MFFQRLFIGFFAVLCRCVKVDWVLTFHILKQGFFFHIYPCFEWSHSKKHLSHSLLFCVGHSFEGTVKSQLILCSPLFSTQLIWIWAQRWRMLTDLPLKCPKKGGKWAQETWSHTVKSHIWVTVTPFFEIKGKVSPCFLMWLESLIEKTKSEMKPYVSDPSCEWKR